MNFLSGIAASILEWMIAKLAGYGLKEIKEVESESAAKKKAEADALALNSATDDHARVVALEQMISDTLGEGTVETTTPSISTPNTPK